MFTSNVLKSKGNIASAARSWEAAVRVMALCISVFLLVAGTCRVTAGELSLGGVPDGFVEDAVEQNVQEQVEQSVQEQVEQNVQERVEDAVEERVLTLGDAGYEAFVEQAVEDQVQDNVESAVEDVVTDNIEVTIQGNIEDDIEQDVETTIEGMVEESVETRVEDVVADSVSQEVENSVEVAVEDELAANAESAAEVQVASSVEVRVEEGIDEIIEKIEVDEGRIQKGQWLVMAAPEVFDQLAREGYLFQTVTELPGMGLRLAEVAAPSSFDITKVRQGVIDIVGSDQAEVDLNHIYTAGDRLAEGSGDGILPRAAVDFPADTDAMPLHIGMIDSQVDVTHPSLRSANIHTRSFAADGAPLPTFHGTAIASIIVGNGGGYVGIAPSAEVYAAGVFEQDPKRGEIASTVSLVRALDWLISSGVDVINISLAGPPNRLLEAALQRASESNVVILAAAGNGGPTAEPMYPAAYNTVVAVTAVDAGGQVFRLANRGDYLQLAAPGVGVRHAEAGGGFTSSSGTSFAVPFAATAVARLRQLQPTDNALELLCRTAEDLGPPGRDSIYGFGLLRPASS